MIAFGAVVLVGLGTFLSRALFILGLAHRTIPPAVLRTLEYVAPATLAALIAAMLTTSGSEAGGGVSLPEVAGLLAAIGCALWTRSLSVVLVVGMVAYWTARAIG